MKSSDQIFRETYVPRFIHAKWICYALIFGGFSSRVFLDRAGIWQEAILALIWIIWLVIFLGVMFHKRYHNYGKNSAIYIKIESLSSVYNRYICLCVLIIFIPIFIYTWVQIKIPDYIKNIKVVTSSDDIERKDWRSDYYWVEVVKMSRESLHWFWKKDQNKSKQITSVTVVGFRRVDHPHDEHTDYFYSKTYKYFKTPIPKNKIKWVRDRLYQKLYQKLAFPMNFRDQCLKRIRSSEHQKHHYSILHKKNSSLLRPTLFLEEVSQDACTPKPLKGSVLFWYIFLIFGSSYVEWLVLKKMINYQKQMTELIQQHNQKQKEEHILTHSQRRFIAITIFLEG